MFERLPRTGHKLLPPYIRVIQGDGVGHSFHWRWASESDFFEAQLDGNGKEQLCEETRM